MARFWFLTAVLVLISAAIIALMLPERAVSQAAKVAGLRHCMELITCNAVIERHPQRGGATLITARLEHGRMRYTYYLLRGELGIKFRRGETEFFAWVVRDGKKINKITKEIGGAPLALVLWPEIDEIQRELDRAIDTGWVVAVPAGIKKMIRAL